MVSKTPSRPPTVESEMVTIAVVAMLVLVVVLIAIYSLADQRGGRDEVLAPTATEQDARLASILNETLVRNAHLRTVEQQTQ